MVYMHRPNSAFILGLNPEVLVRPGTFEGVGAAAELRSLVESAFSLQTAALQDATRHLHKTPWPFTTVASV